MVEEVGIKRGSFGATYKFVVKGVDYSAYSAKIYVQSSGGTLLINGDACTVSATDGSKNTLVEYTPASGKFGAAASLVKYLAEIEFSGAAFRDPTETFFWKVHDELRG